MRIRKTCGFISFLFVISFLLVSQNHVVYSHAEETTSETQATDWVTTTYEISKVDDDSRPCELNFNVTLNDPSGIDYVVLKYGRNADLSDGKLDSELYKSNFVNKKGKMYFIDKTGGIYYFQLCGYTNMDPSKDYFVESCCELKKQSQIFCVDRWTSIEAQAQPRANNSGVILNWNSLYTSDKYTIVRSESESGPFSVIAKGVNEEKTDSDEYDEGMKLSYNTIYLDTTAKASKTYYYKVELRDDADAVVGSSMVVSAIAKPKGTSFVSVKETKFQTFAFKWKKRDGCIGYLITGVRIKGEEGDREELEVFRKEVAGGDTTSLTIKKYKHGGSTTFRIQPIYNVNGVNVYGLRSECFPEMKYTEYYAIYDLDSKQMKYYKWPRTQKQARKECKTIVVKTWEFKNHSTRSGGKYTKKISLTVNKHIAKYVKRAFKKVYKSKSKPVIYEAGSYRWRPSESNWSYHTVGLAVDMNCNENPMYGAGGKISVGSFYRPKTNAYSFPKNGVVQKAFEKYGMYRLGFDLMHFENAEGKFYDKPYEYWTQPG